MAVAVAVAECVCVVGFIVTSCVVFAALQSKIEIMLEEECVGFGCLVPRDVT